MSGSWVEVLGPWRASLSDATQGKPSSTRLVNSPLRNEKNACEENEQTPSSANQPRHTPGPAHTGKSHVAGGVAQGRARTYHTADVRCQKDGDDGKMGNSPAAAFLGKGARRWVPPAHSDAGSSVLPGLRSYRFVSKSPISCDVNSSHRGQPHGDQRGGDISGMRGRKTIEGERSEQRGLFHALENTEAGWARGGEGDRFTQFEAQRGPGGCRGGRGRVGAGGLPIPEPSILSRPGVFRGSAPPWCFQNKIISKSLELQVCLLSGV